MKSSTKIINTRKKLKAMEILVIYERSCEMNMKNEKYV